MSGLIAQLCLSNCRAHCTLFSLHSRHLKSSEHSVYRCRAFYVCEIPQSVILLDGLWIVSRINAHIGFVQVHNVLFVLQVFVDAFSLEKSILMSTTVFIQVNFPTDVSNISLWVIQLMRQCGHDETISQEQDNQAKFYSKPLKLAIDEMLTGRPTVCGLAA